MDREPSTFAITSMGLCVQTGRSKPYVWHETRLESKPQYRPADITWPIATCEASEVLRRHQGRFQFIRPRSRDGRFFGQWLCLTLAIGGGFISNSYTMQLFSNQALARLLCDGYNEATKPPSTPRRTIRLGMRTTRASEPLVQV